LHLQFTPALGVRVVIDVVLVLLRTVGSGAKPEKTLEEQVPAETNEVHLDAHGFSYR